MATLDRPFLGSEALTAGLVRKHELRTRFTSLYPDVYLPVGQQASLVDRARAAWLWSHREGEIAGLTASAMHGAKWIDASLPIELVCPNARAPAGMRTYDYRLPADEFEHRDGLRVATVERTAFDSGRRGRLGDAVARLDALGNATQLQVDAVVELAARHRRTRGLRQLERALALYDPGAESPKETWLRLLLLDAGFPRPQTQVPVLGPNGHLRYRLDIGWEDILVAVEYDGEQHRIDRPSYVNDVIRLEYVNSVGWLVVRVVADNRRSEIVDRVRRARESRLR